MWKIHAVKITFRDPASMGSIAIDGDLLDAEGKRPGEKVSVADVDSMNRFGTWVFRCARGRGSSA